MRPAAPLLALAVATVATLTLATAQPAATPRPTAKGWELAAQISARIKPPVFPARDFVITAYGAVPGGKEDATAAIRKAIQACHAAGGGRVVVPPGEFLTGAIHLESRVNLHVAQGATLRFQTDPAAYLPPVFTRWEGIECMNYSPFIYAIDAQDVAVTGPGTLDGAASEENWWRWARKGADKKTMASPDIAELNAMSERGVPAAQRVFGAGHYLRPNFIQTYRCKNVLIDGLTILRSPMWEVHPVLSTNVTVRNLKVVTHGPNNDGCDPESSRDVLIENCLFDVGDDCIAIKSGRNEDGRRVGRPVENIIVRGCTMKDGHGGVSIGSEISGGARNIFIENDTMDSANLDRALRLKSNARRGGVIEDVYMRNVEIGRVSEAVLTVDLLYEEGARGAFPPVVRRISVENVTSRRSPRLFYLLGFPGATIDDIRVASSRIEGVEATEVMESVGKVTLDRVTVTPAVKPRSLSSRQLTP